MYKSRLLTLTRTLERQPALRTTRPTRQAYSSLRRPRQPGPRSRVLNHVEPVRNKPIRYAVENMAPKITTEEALIYEKPAPSQEAQSTVDTLVTVPIDKEHQIVKPDSRGAALLTQSAIVVGRELEMMNVFLGYEQANRYKIMDPQGNHIGYIAEEEGLGKSISRQFLRTHRKMNATIMNAQGEVVFKIVRPYSLVNSRIFIYTANDELVGEVQQRWNLMRRKYDLFVGTKQFASIDTPFLGWDFNLQDEHGGTLGNVSRNFVGFAREIFTDTGEYVLRMDAVDGNSRGMTLDERAVTLACAVSIDFDYFSRHSTHGSGGFMPFPMFGMGGSGVDNKQDDQSTADAGTTAAGSAVGENSGSFGGNNMPPPSNAPAESNTNEWGDPWLSDEQAGVSNPDDEGSFLDTLSDFFGNNDV
ncbi:Scramblase-domain-containing protein [Parasitella parasitica]|nr:Scramblase-domain-containing protein [Parasitella parasitica]